MIIPQLPQGRQEWKFQGPFCIPTIRSPLAPHCLFCLSGKLTQSRAHAAFQAMQRCRGEGPSVSLGGVRSNFDSHHHTSVCMHMQSPGAPTLDCTGVIETPRLVFVHLSFQRDRNKVNNMEFQSPTSVSSVTAVWKWRVRPKT